VIDLKLRPTPGAVPDARRALDALDEEVSARTLEDLRLLVSELVTNSVRHAGLEKMQTIELKVKLLPDTVRVEVNDQGTGFTPTPRNDRSEDQSGWGLYLVSRLADRWGVSSDGVTRVWFELTRHRT
jgi:anti-sigma regulatory factor (Ser/Thr protein kinase)